jgi:hypothetical protein
MHDIRHEVFMKGKDSSDELHMFMANFLVKFNQKMKDEKLMTWAGLGTKTGISRTYLMSLAKGNIAYEAVMVSYVIRICVTLNIEMGMTKDYTSKEEM